MSVLTRADVRSGCWRIWGSARTRASLAASVRSGEQGQPEADAKARRSSGAAARRLGGRDAAHRQGMIVTLVGVCGLPTRLCICCRWTLTTGAAVPHGQHPGLRPAAAAAASRRHQRRLPPTADAASSARRLLQRQPPSFSRCAPSTSRQCQLRSSQRNGGARARSEGRCFVSTRRAQRFRQPQSAQPAEQLATTIRQLRGARIQAVTDLHCKQFIDGGVAQMVERSLSMREVRGSIPRTSK